MSSQGIKCLECNPTMEGQVKLVQNVVYSTETGSNLSLSLLLPWNVDNPDIKKEKKPLIVYVQGSAWTTPDRDFQIPQLSEFARKGYIVATVDHRNALLGNAFPAFLQDVKCAIRFLRKNAEVYGIDADKVAIWGTSSGGNAALLVGLTGDDPKYKTEEYKDYSDKVIAVVECFGPTNLPAMIGVAEEEDYAIPEINYILSGLCGGDMNRFSEVANKMSPINYVEKGKDVPPFLLLHGDNDSLVPFEQMTMLYDKMIASDYEVEAWQIKGAEHEGTFWSQSVYNIIGDFLERKLR